MSLCLSHFARLLPSVIAMALLAVAGLSARCEALGQTPPSDAPSEFQTAAAEAQEEFFEKKIRPLLVSRCQECHGAAKSWADLRLDTAAGLKKGGENGPVVVAGKPGESELYRRIASEEEETRMPPADSGKRLTADEIALLRQWIEAGAVWPAEASTSAASGAAHWAFQKVRRVDPPSSPEGFTNPIDCFVAAMRREKGLSASPPADRRTLLRRASYAATGLPPSPEEVAAFVADPDPDAYEKAVDRLLQSPQYGEKWARLWLDVARYSDTKGYVYAREEREFYHASHYRDWVIRAFNDDLPYDRFLLLQLAADQAAPDQPEHLAAMGFLTLGRRFLGVESDLIDDKIDVVGRGMLGLTIGCARCHDHKYDPIPTADYYSLYGVFRNCIERSADLPRSDRPPPDEAYRRGLEERERNLASLTAQRRAEAERRIRSRIGDYLYAQRQLDQYPDASFNTVKSKEDVIPGVVLVWEEYLSEAKGRRDPMVGAWLLFAEIPDDQFSQRAAEVCQTIASDPSHHPRIAALFQTPPASAREVADRYGQLFAEIDQKWRTWCALRQFAGAPPAALPDPEEERLRAFLYEAPSPCVIPHESVSHTEWWWDLDTVVALWSKQADLDRWLIQGQEVQPRAIYVVDAPHLVTPRIFKRGNTASKGAKVPRQNLELLAGAQRKPFTQGSGRLELAQAIIDPENPLTARVWVNRVWRQHFGEGLVTSMSDFGLRAGPPSHPELLDWLASEFVAHGYSHRWLHRMIMTSQTYQQSSQGPANREAIAQAQSLDPENRYLWRMPTRRLSWEEQRDTFLALAGQLDRSMGGKSVEAFAAGPQGTFRRSIYNRIDRQYLPTYLSSFDFANPDMHSPQRTDTTAPQQALFLLNHPFVADRAKAIAQRASDGAASPADAATRLFTIILQRGPSDAQHAAAIAFLEAAEADSAGKPAALTPLQKLAQLLLISNEVLFVD